MSYPIGTIMAFLATGCPHCGQFLVKEPPGAFGIAEERIWTGSEWIKLDSWDGHVLALRLAEMGNDGALNMREYRQQKEGK